MMRSLVYVRWILTTVSVSAAVAGGASLSAAEPISLDGFRDGIRHWQNGQNQESYPRLANDQVREICDNLLLHQRANGGWPSNFDPLRVLSEAEKEKLRRERDREETSFDNRATYPQIEYLARAYGQLGDERFRKAVVDGLKFILAAQYAHGGWPHSFPSRKGYHPHVTIVDDVMVGILTALRPVAAGGSPYEFVDSELRSRVADAVARGDACLLRLQVTVDGQPTGWAAQYDEVTLQPTTGRSFELPALVSSESVGVLRYLMRIESPSEQVRRAVESGARWLDRSKIAGLAIKRVPAEVIRYAHHTSRDDVVAVSDPDAPPIWARFYEIETNRPFMANRDGRKVDTLAEVERERRTGYSWYGGYATSFLEREYPGWIRRWSAEESKP